MHVCVIGAGVVGLTTAYFLQAEGHSVTVIDRASSVGTGASGANGAQLVYSIGSEATKGEDRTSILAALLTHDPSLRLRPHLEPRLWKWMRARARADGGA